MSQRGHGASGRPTAGYRTRDFSEDLRAFMKALDLGLLVYEDAGHALHWKEPARFAADFVAFARSLVRG